MFRVLAFLYMLPGRVMLWWTYMNPEGGITGVAKSGRNYRSPFFTFLTATGFWFVGGYLVAENFDDFEFSNASSGPLVKPGSSQSPTSVSQQSATARPASSSNANVAGADSACEKAKKTAAQAQSVEDLELAKAKVNALC